MRARTIIGAGLVTVLAGAIWNYQSPASAQGWGMMDGYGPGYDHMSGWAGEQGAGPWNCPAFNDGRSQDNGPGYHMPGFGSGYGPGMMGDGRGYAARGTLQGDQNAGQSSSLTTDDVKTRIERWLAWRGNPRLKVGEIKEKDADTIIADVVTQDNSLVERFIVDRHTGIYRRGEG